MKPVLLLFTLAFVSVRAAEVPLPEFNSGAIGHPPLSLGELSKGNIKPMPFGYQLPSVNDLPAGGLLGGNSRPASARLMPSPPRFQQKSEPGQMPILEPNPNVDYKIVLKQPDPTIDPKILIAPRQTPRK